MLDQQFYLSMLINQGSRYPKKKKDSFNIQRDMNPRDRHPLRRRSFLVTCWQELDSTGGDVLWRFNLETPAANNRRLFVNLQDVMAEIERELSRDTDKDG